MTYTKNILTLLFFIGISSSAVLANGPVADKEKKKAELCEQEKKEKDAAEVVKPDPKAVNYSAASQKSRSEGEALPGLKNKADSSSVLSYNFIFYLVYKFKYTESEQEFSQESRATD